MASSFKSRYFGDRRFYKMVLSVAVPVMIQNGITNFVSLLDNIMVGRIGTNEMTGVASANQILFVYNLCCFGAMSGAGIFTAQFFGKNDQKGVSDTMRFKLYTGAGLAAIGTLVFLLFGEPLINLYLQGEGSAADALASLTCGVQYLRIMLLGLLPFVLVQCYAGSLRETGETFVPMLAGVIAVLVNLCFNYMLIFGHFGFPAMGAAGAAIATVLSRYVELAIVMVWAHTHKKRYPFIQYVFKTPVIPLPLTRSVIIKGMPLMLNELFWSAGMAALTQCYSVRGLHVVAAVNISSTISNVFNVVYMALGSSVSIIVGQLLGAGKMEEAVDTDRKMISFSVFGCLGVGVLLFFAAPLFPMIYNTTDEVRAVAAAIIRVCAVHMPFGSFMNACYFTLRSGGKTVVTFFFDSVFVCCVSFPVAYVLAHFTSFPIIPLYITVLALDIIKCVVGYVLVRKRVWVNNIVA